MKYFQYLAYIALFIILFQTSCVSTAASKPAEEQKQQVQAGIFNFDGYHSKDKKGRLTGYGIDLLGLLSEHSHLNFAFKGYEKSWQEMQEMLKNGEIDIVSSARRTPEREELFAFSLPVGRNHTMLSKQLFNTKLKAGDYSTYNGMKIGAVAGSSQNNDLADFAKDKGFTYTLVEFESPQKMARALQSGEVDAILSSNLRKPKNETLLDIIKSDNFYIIARKEDQNLIDEINYAIEQMNLNEGDWQNDIYYKHYGPDTSAIPEFSDRENEYMQSVAKGEREIVATARRDIPPYSYVENGELKGILPDFFARTMHLIGLPYKLVAPAGDGGLHNANVILDKLGSGLDSRNNFFDGFTTDPYMITGMARVTRGDFTGAAKSVAIPDALSMEIYPELLENVEVKHYSSSEEAMRAVKDGEADAAYILPFTAQMLINHDPGNTLIYTMLDTNGASFKMYVPTAEDHELITILKKAVKRVPEGTINQIGSDYISYNAHDMTLLDYLHANPEIMLIGSLAIMMTASLMAIMWLHGSWSRRLLATTTKSKNELTEQLAIVEALSRDYSNVLTINREDGSAQIVKIAGSAVQSKPDEAAEDTETYAQVLEKAIKQKVHPEDRDYMARALSLAEILTQLESKDEYSGTYRTLERGDVHHYQFTFVKPHKEDIRNDNLILAGFRNIDEAIRREQKQKSDLSKALAQARYASAAKTAFLNNMSHDIRTPMNAIIGFTALATENVKNIPLVRRYLGKIMTSGNHLLSLINDVLDMSRIESGKVKLVEQEIRLPEILHDLRTIAQADVKAKRLNFQIEAINITNETIVCDRLRLNQILLNILSNAIKYTPAGGDINVSVIQTTPEENGEATFEFHIADTGIGMSKQFLEHVFEPFEREQTATVSGIQGTGLGLAITKNLVDMIGGVIDVQSEAGAGSEFIVTFKFKVASENESQPLPPGLCGKRALVVESDETAGKSLVKMLTELGLKPDLARSGREAHKLARESAASSSPYAAYVINNTLSDINGLLLTRRLRDLAPAPIPIIVLTAQDIAEMEEAARDAGVTSLCSKPAFRSDLRKVFSGGAPHKEDENSQLTASEVFAGKRLLLAEDNEMNQEIAQMILENVGFELDIVENGQLAVEKIRSMPPHTYELILMDVQMPVMNGYDATRNIRKLEDKEKADIPIIAMTANAFDEDRDEAIRSGMNGYIAKPIDIAKLLETLEDILKKPSA